MVTRDLHLEDWMDLCQIVDPKQILFVGGQRVTPWPAVNSSVSSLASTLSTAI